MDSLHINEMSLPSNDSHSITEKMILFDFLCSLDPLPMVANLCPLLNHLWIMFWPPQLLHMHTPLSPPALLCLQIPLTILGLKVCYYLVLKFHAYIVYLKILPSLLCIISCL